MKRQKQTAVPPLPFKMPDVEPLNLTPEKEQLLNLMLEIEQYKFMIECISEWKNVDRCKQISLIEKQRSRLSRAEDKIKRLISSSAEAKEAYERAMAMKDKLKNA
jgi:hypothetical protein